MKTIATNIFQRIAEKQERYRTLPNEIREMINKVEGMNFIYKGQDAIVKCIYADSTADIIVLDIITGEENEVNVKLTEI